MNDIPAKSRDLAGTAILLTGASGGIGRALVPALLAAGVDKVLAADRSAMQWDDDRVQPLVLDITDSHSVANAAKRHANGIDILINNAGHNHNTRFIESDGIENAAREMDVNYFGTLRMIRAFAPAMKQRHKGVIVNMITVGAHVCFPNMGSYCASKAALHSMTQSVRAELGYFGIDVVGIYPPAVDTAMSAHVPPAQKIATAEVAAATVRALREGVDETYIGMAADFYERIRREPKAVEAMLKGRVAPAGK